MTKDEETALRVFETRVRQLILQYKQLEGENRRLAEAVEESRKAVERVEAENERLRRNYANLKLAKMMNISDGDLKDAKSRLAKLVRDVDKCIALLNV